MSNVSLSSGCFINNERFITQLADRANSSIELSGHTSQSFNSIIKLVREYNIQVNSIHSPCPKLESEINLACDDDNWEQVSKVLEENMALAALLGAKFVVIHAFYTISDFPSNDLKRAETFDSFSIEGSMKLSEYRKSDIYQSSLNKSIKNLKSVIPTLKKLYPSQKILIENLNPRIGYGGVSVDDLREMSEALDGDIGICLDVGHLALTSKITKDDLSEEVRKTKEHILSTHLHKNFMGEYYIDRRWDSKSSEGFQETDMHFPLLAKYKYLEDGQTDEIRNYNSFFSQILDGAIQYSNNGFGIDEYDYQLKNWLSYLNPTTNKVLEYDSRYAPLKEIIKEYFCLLDDNHPILTKSGGVRW